MNNMELDEVILKQIESAVREAGSILLSAHLEDGEIHQKKGPANFVTDYDVRIQQFLMERFSEILPSATYFGEEETAGNDHAVGDGYVFFIDPIDGTTNFMFDYGNSCVSVGLAKDRKIIAGWVYNPYADRMYHAARGRGAWLNGKTLMMENKSLEEGIAAFGCARYNDGGVDLMFDVVKELFLASLSVRNGGSAAIDLCRIASGSNVAYVELLLQPYDYAAASVIIEEADGVIGQVNGSEITLDRPCSILGGTKKAVEEVKRIYERCCGRER